MKSLLYVLATSATFLLSLNANVETGEAAPDFALSDTAAVTHSLSDYKGQYVVLEWTNHQCPFVRKHYKNGDMQALQKAYTEKGIVWLQIVSSAKGKQGYVTAAEGAALREQKAMHSTAMLLDADGSVGKAYDARTTPHIFLIDPAGKLIYQGAIDSIRSTRSADVTKAENYLNAALVSDQAGQAIAMPSTTPYGCSVKY